MDKLISMKDLVPYAMRLPMVLLVTVFFATLVDTLLGTFYYEWHLILGIYVPLLSMNCLILTNADENALRHGFKDVIGQTLLLGVGIIGSLFLVGLIREIMSGSIFSESGLLIFEMAPGAFLALGLIIALLNYLNMRITKVCD